MSRDKSNVHDLRDRKRHDQPQIQSISGAAESGGLTDWQANRCLTVTEAAAFLNISKSSLDHWRRDRKNGDRRGPNFVQLSKGGPVRYPVRWLIEFVEENRRASNVDWQAQ